MCEFCHQHGEGEKWYLRAEHYAADLLSDLERREYITHFFRDTDRLGKNVARLDTLNRLPAFVQAVVKPWLVNRQKRTHYGQVLPLEDIEKILGFTNSVVRLPCICRHVTMGSEQRYCYGLSMEPGDDTTMGRLIRSIGADYLTGPHTSGLETLTKDDALEQFKEIDRQGMIHSVWTFMTPFIGGICNCDLNCLAMRAMSKSYPVMFRSEYLATVNPELCSGCQACLKTCQFKAMRVNLKDNKVVIEQESCYGCGLCRTACREVAITLTERQTLHPEPVNGK